MRDYLLERFVIAGTRAEVSARLDALASRGVHRFSASVADVSELEPGLELINDLID